MAGFWRLVGDLIAATRTGKVDWVDTADEDMFRAISKHGAIRIAESTEYDGTSEPTVSYTLFILNKHGKVADSYTPSGPDVDESATRFKEARRSARDAESVIKGIFAELR